MAVQGNFSASGMSLPAASVLDAQVAASAAIGYSKLNRLRSRIYAQPNIAAVTETKVIEVYRSVGAGTIIDFSAGVLAAAVGAATVTIDLKKNGTTILAGLLTIDNTLAINTLKFNTPSSLTLAINDVLTLVITAAAGGGTLPTGLFINVRYSEAAI